MSNVYILPPGRGNQASNADIGNPFDQLTDRLIMAQASAGTLNPAIVAALLAAVRQPAGERSR